MSAMMSTGRTTGKATLLGGHRAGASRCGMAMKPRNAPNNGALRFSRTWSTGAALAVDQLRLDGSLSLSIGRE